MARQHCRRLSVPSHHFVTDESAPHLMKPCRHGGFTPSVAPPLSHDAMHRCGSEVSAPPLHFHRVVIPTTANGGSHKTHNGASSIVQRSRKMKCAFLFLATCVVVAHGVPRFGLLRMNSSAKSTAARKSPSSGEQSLFDTEMYVSRVGAF